MFVQVTILGNGPVTRKYKQMMVLGFRLCWRRWRKLRDADSFGSPCSRSVASMIVESPLTLFFYVFRKRLTA